jgi:hypothetical protein
MLSSTFSKLASFFASTLQPPVFPGSPLPGRNGPLPSYWVLQLFRDTDNFFYERGRIKQRITNLDFKPPLKQKAPLSGGVVYAG